MPAIQFEHIYVHRGMALIPSDVRLILDIELLVGTLIRRVTGTSGPLIF